MGDEPEWRRLNRANWDERVPIHIASRMYDQTGLRAGRDRLGAWQEAELGPVAGLRLLHLQCHFGMDTLIFAQQGAEVAGVDFSAPAIEAAQGLAAELGLSGRARFVCSDVYEAPAALPEPASFDRVFVSWGALCWLPDISGWAQVVAHFLRPGGFLYLAEAHPAAYVLDDSAGTPGGMPGWFAPYLGRAPIIEDWPEDYADPTKPLQNARVWEWLHPLSDTIGGLLQAGLQLDFLHEHDNIPWQFFKCLVRGGPDNWFRWPDKPWLPLSFSLRASKPVSKALHAW
ncbi:MAG: class I SAM-dependent methyltransferase [Acetobacteraceae bacterium]|nr:class I SAM-dependent methyltransferase [Acetobacteraceae bacterium]